MAEVLRLRLETKSEAITSVEVCPDDINATSRIAGEGFQPIRFRRSFAAEQCC
jgi:hypothetical protein